MSSLPLFPYDIWIQIAHCIPPTHLEGLFNVNSAFFHLAMEQRYRQISFAYLGSKMMRLLWRLKDPDVAKRVRILHMHPHFMRELIDAESTTSEADSVFSLFAKHQKILTYRKTHLRRRSYTLDTVMMNLMSVLRGLPNLSEYHIAWVSPTLPSYPSFLTTPLLHSPIRRLCLEMTWENLERLHPLPSMERLRELDLFLRPGHTLDATRYGTILTHVLAPVIAAHPNLNSLSLRLFEPMNISPLFSSLPLLPELRSLSVTVPLTAPHLGNPDFFADFLNAHTQTLRHLCLRISDLSSPVFGLIDASLVRWMQMAFKYVHIESLRVLEVGMGLMPPESAQLVVRRFGALDKLILTGRCLTLEEVEGLLPRTLLKRLRIGPVVLSPQMVDAFAECTPDLERLEVVGTDLVPYDGDSVVPDYEHGGQDDSQVAKFIEEMAKRVYDTWALRTLELDGRGRCPAEREMWRACIPSLRNIMV